MTTLKRKVTTGKTVGSRGRPTLGCCGLASRRICRSQEGHPPTATDTQIEEYPQGRPRGGEDDRPSRLTEIPNRPEQPIQDNDIGRTCSCGKVLKNQHGLKIHQSRMGCQPHELRPRTTLVGETQEEPDPDAHHSVRSLSESDIEEDSQSVLMDQAHQEQDIPDPKKPRVKWPKSADLKSWREFDEDVDTTLEVISSGNINKKIKTMTAVIQKMGMDRFGEEERRQAREKPQPNRREKEIAEIRRELKQLTRVYRDATDDERIGLAEIRSTLRERLFTLRRAENHRRNRRERARKRSQFVRNPFQFTKRLLGDTRSGRLQCPREEVQDHLRKTHNDPRREEELGDFPLLVPDEPEAAFDMSEPKLQEVRNIIKRARAKSAPGPDQVPYKVYKNCPKLTRRLWKYLKVVWRKGKLVDEWMSAEGCFIPKEENSSTLSQFRTISLLNVEGKIFLALVARRITSFLMKNSYIDTSIQKGGIPGTPGCIEHTSAVSQIIQEAKENKGDLVVLWLDLTNAYGSIPHKVVEEMLKRYHIPEKIRAMLKDYFDRFQMRFTVGSYTTDWQRLEIGIATGCTISVILFAAAMNLLVKSVEKQSRGPTTKSGVKLPPTRAFMDDMTVTARSVIEGRWMLEDLDRAFTWARMSFKPAKSRSLVLKRGKVEDRFRFKVGDKVIPTVTEKPVKSLGKWFDSSLKDTGSIKMMVAQVDEWMQQVEKSGLPGKFKAWIFQHGVLPRLLWPLLVYDVPLSTVETVEKKVTSHLRRWLGVPSCFSSVNLYSRDCKLQLPLSSTTEEFKVTKARQLLMLRDSNDKKIREAEIPVKTGRKWSVKETVSEAESRLRHQDIVGSTAVGRLGIGCITRASWRTSDTAERRTLTLEEVRKMEEEQRLAKAITLSQQGQWMKWEGVRQKKVAWNDIWRSESNSVKFLLRSVFDVLPSPTNLVRWGKREDPFCSLCGRPANLEHILSSCQRALIDGRYRWRHDRILAVMAHHLEKALKKSSNQTQRLTFIDFVRAGESGSNQRKQGGILSTAGDWQLKVDLHHQLIFPPEVLSTTLRPDIVLWSKNSRTVVLLELTVPWETRAEEAHERKKRKYQQLVDECAERRWKTWNLPFEVGTRGFVCQSTWRALGLLGIVGSTRKETCKGLEDAAEKASRWLWICREQQWRSST